MLRHRQRQPGAVRMRCPGHPGSSGNSIRDYGLGSCVTGCGSRHGSARAGDRSFHLRHCSSTQENQRSRRELKADLLDLLSPRLAV